MPMMVETKHAAAVVCQLFFEVQQTQPVTAHYETTGQISDRTEEKSVCECGCELSAQNEQMRHIRGRMWTHTLRRKQRLRGRDHANIA